MRSAIRLGLLSLAALGAHAGDLPYFTILSDDPGSWPQILSSVGMQSQPAAVSRVFVTRRNAAAAPEWKIRVERGSTLILEGDSSLAAMFGFRPSSERVKVTSVEDVHRPGLRIVWEKGLELPRFQLPPGAQIFAKDRWTGAPLVAGFRIGSGALLWVATSPGNRGYERFPYLLSALYDLGLEAPFRTSRLWAFFDSAYRSRVDLDYFAAKWRKAGISALHVAAWKFYDSDPEQDRYLVQLISACHREGILVYAWLELPHVSERFWQEHPEWREQTALLQDAQLDWRKIMNLSTPGCFRAVSDGIRGMISRFDWDGINLAELYFESLEGIANPARFTPMNPDIRAQFAVAHGFDPIELFRTRQDAASRRLFLDFRSERARAMQEQWLNELESYRAFKPDLDLVLTHVDDRLDPGIRDAIGADSSRVLPLLEQHSFTFLVEDPATVWNLGAQRYQTLADRYRGLTRHAERLAIDLNIVDRYQNVYPTKQQTGTELFQLVHQASTGFSRVALYCENSLLDPDLKLLSSAAASVSRMDRIGAKTVVDSATPIGLPWKGPALVDGQPWAAMDPETLWLPAGPHSVEPTAQPLPIHLVRFNGELKATGMIGGALQFTYQSSARALAILDRVPGNMQIDSLAAHPVLAGPMTILLPRGQHVVTLAIQ